MSRVSRYVVLLVLLGLSSMPAAAAERALLSIRGIVLPDNGYVGYFDVKTWGVKVISVCHLPPGWTMTAGKSADPSGVLSGQASLGVTFLNLTDLHELDGLFLIETDSYREKDQPNQFGGNLPASFNGVVGIGTYGQHDLDVHDVPLTASNFVHEPAERCS